MKYFWKLYSLAYDILLELYPYQEMMREILSFIPAKNVSNIIDAGCGTGNVLKELAGKFAKSSLVGLDSSTEMLNRAKAKLPKKIILKQSTLDKKLPFADSFFDIIISSNVLYFVEKPLYTLKEFLRIIRANGLLILTTLKPGFNPFNIIGKHLKRVGFFKTIKYIIPLCWVGFCNIYSLRSKKCHYYNENELKSLIQKAGFSIVDLKETYAGQDWLVIAKRVK